MRQLPHGVQTVEPDGQMEKLIIVSTIMAGSPILPATIASAWASPGKLHAVDIPISSTSSLAMVQMRPISNNVNLDVWQALGSRNGGEAISDGDY